MPGEALRRIGEGRRDDPSKGEAGTGDIVEAVRDLRKIREHPLSLTPTTWSCDAAKELQSPLDLVRVAARISFPSCSLRRRHRDARPTLLVMQRRQGGSSAWAGHLQVEDPAAVPPIVEATTTIRTRSALRARSRAWYCDAVARERAS